MRNKLLAIDGAELHLSILRKIAEQVGFTATGAHSAVEANRLLSERTFDCITLDPSLADLRHQRFRRADMRGDRQDRQLAQARHTLASAPSDPPCGSAQGSDWDRRSNTKRASRRTRRGLVCSAPVAPCELL